MREPDLSPATVFCFPFAGGGAGVFRRMRADLGVSVVPVQYPGREERYREPLETNLDGLARDAARQLLAHEPVALVVLLGHSLGARVAVSTAALLADSDLPLRLLIVSNGAPPRRILPDADRLSDEALLAATAAVVGHTPVEYANPELRSIVAPILRQDLALQGEICFPEGGLKLPIACLRGREDPVVTRAEARRWGRYTTVDATYREIDGGHMNLVEDPHTWWRAVVQTLREHGLVAQ